MKAQLVDSIQSALRAEKLDGWLFYSFRGSDPIAENILHLDNARLATRRWFYFVPASGTPQKIVHAIESEMLDSLPGNQRIYLPWQQLHQQLQDALSDSLRVAMQYSPLNAIPYISRVDAGTVELIRSFGVDVVSSADLVQIFEAVDFLLLDIWAKRKVPHSVYDDITWTGFIGKEVPNEHARIFDVVKDGRDAAIRFVAERYPHETLHGWQVDDASRGSIAGAGYGRQFIHRTGHSIHEEDHGNGANIDNLETEDSRRLMTGTCFSIEPGVYLKGRFGVRSEVNVYLAPTEATVTGLPIQTRVVPILSF
jgi:hypothetical protein